MNFRRNLNDPATGLPNQGTDNVVLDLLSIFRIFRRRFLFIALLAVVFAVAMAGLSLSMKPVYEATSQVIFDPTIRQPFDTPERARRTLGTEAVDSQISVIHSDTVLRPVVRNMQLVNDPIFADPAPSGLFSLLKSVFSPAKSTIGETLEAQETAAVEKLSESLSVKRVGLTFVINITAESRSPQQAAALANAIAESYVSDQGRQISQASKEAAVQIDDRLIGLRERLREAESEIQKFRADNRLQNAADGWLLTEQELSGLNTQLVEARAALAAATAKTNEIQRVLNSGVDAGAIGDAVNSDTIASLREQYAIASRNQADLLADLLPSHPQVARATSQLNRVRNLIRDEVERIAQSAQIDLKVNQERVSNLEQQLDAARNMTDADEAASIKLRELETEAQATRTLYELALARAKEISELDQVILPTVRIITPAVSPESPVWPKKKLLVLLGGILGGLIGTVLAVGGEALRIAKKHLLPPEYEMVNAPGALPHTSVSDMAQPPRTDIVEGPVAPPAAGTLNFQSQTPTRSERSQRELEVICQLPLLSGTRKFGSLKPVSQTDIYAAQNAVSQYYSGVQGPDQSFGMAIDRIINSIVNSPSADGNHTVLFTSPSLGHGQTITAFALALGAAHRNLNVLLADGEPKQRLLSHNLSLENERDALSLRDDVIDYDKLGISFLSLVTGQPKYKKHQIDIRQAFEFADIAKEFDIVIIDGPILSELDASDPLAGLASNIIVTMAEGAEKHFALPIISEDVRTIAEDRPSSLVRTMVADRMAA